MDKRINFGRNPGKYLVERRAAHTQTETAKNKEVGAALIGLASTRVTHFQSELAKNSKVPL